MAGIYLHIPFCKTRCIYCDFYSTTRNDLRQRYVRALCRELVLRRDYLRGATVETVYFGGGTPSQLTEEDFESIFQTLQDVYGLEHAREITLEANPDDLTDEYVRLLRHFPFNRISMGIQTFDDQTLQLLQRRHSAAQAIEAVQRCREAGFKNLNIDLIYGLPGETEEKWKHDLQEAVSLHPEHISAYHLTYEEGTPLYRLRETHRVNEVNEEDSLRFFTLLVQTLRKAGYVHYEISNFCLPGHHARHNTAYWQGIPYLGCGPSAHSFDTDSREWNQASLTAYIDGLEKNERPFEAEKLDNDTRYNEYVMTGMRTRWGISLEKIATDFGTKRLDYLRQMAHPHLQRGKLIEKEGRFCLTEEGIFTSDDIISDLMYV